MKSKFSLSAYLILALVEGLLSILLLSIIPGDPKNAWMLGLSKPRILMLAAGLLVLSIFTLLVRKILKDEAWYIRLSQRVEKTLRWEGHLTTGFVFSLAGFVGGSYFLFTALTTTDLFLKGYFIRLAPWVFWFTTICGQTLLFLIFHDVNAWKGYIRSHGLAILALWVILVAGLIIHLKIGDMDPDALAIYSPNDQIDYAIKEQDIYLVYQEGQNLLNGENPYGRASKIDENRWNKSLPTYLPMIYYGSWLTHRAGIRTLDQWLSLWRSIFLFFNLCIAYLLFYIPHHRYHAPVLGIIAASLWLFNRWTLHVTMISHFNFIPIFFFLLSLSLLPKHKFASFILFGLSLSIKHNAIFMTPIYLIWAWKLEERNSIKNVLVATLAIGSIPFLASFPFLIQDLGGFIRSLAISLTRYPETHIGVLSLDALFGWVGIQAKIPLFLMISVAYLLAWREKISYFATSLLVMTIFVDFHSVLFRHYMVWTVPLVLLTICETVTIRPPSWNK